MEGTDSNFSPDSPGIPEYINPDPQDDTMLKRAIIGSLRLEMKVVETFYLFAKVNNIYGSEYSYRDGYLEPGRIFLGGLRIII